MITGVIEYKKGTLIVRKLNPAELSEDLKDWTLGDLYRIGDPVIGGWPQ